MIGSHLGKWILDCEIGRGGMGCVYLAHDVEQPESQAAVKVLAAELTAHAGAVHRFEREIQVLQKLNHPNVVRFYESGTHQGLLYFVMEYVEGLDFAELLEEEERLPWSEVLDTAIQVCAALKHAHQHGVTHRDIKPSNLLRGENGQVKLTDFGVAAVFAGKHLTRAGAVVGTAEYLSPEQAEGKPATDRSDLYSLGCVLYTLLCGRTPFQGDNVLDLLHKHRYAQFDSPGKVIPALPPELDEIIVQLLEKSPDKRPPNAHVLLRRLEALRRKLAYRGEHTVDNFVLEPTQLGDTFDALTDDSGAARGEGPATLMSRLLRKELDTQNHGGPVRQLFNRPAVLVTLFVLCAGTLLYALWPDDPEKIYEDGRALMESKSPKNYAPGWEKLEKAEARLAGRHAAEIERYRRIYQEFKEAREADQRNDRLGEARWFYTEGLRRRQQGQADAARQTWRNLIGAFRDVPAEQSWVRLAELELAKDDGDGADARRWRAVEEVLEQARRLRQDDKLQDADDKLAALEALYRDDPSAKDVLDEIRRERGK